MNDVRYIPLSQGNNAMIDADDYERINQYRWHTLKGKTNTYAVRYENDNSLIWKNGRQTIIYLHRFILGLSAYKDNKIVVDHKNRNGLDCRKENLRAATGTQNSINKNVSNPTGYRGTYKLVKSYGYQIKIGKANHRVSGFKTLEEAARAYDAKAKEVHGEFAYLNFP